MKVSIFLVFFLSFSGETLGDLHDMDLISVLPIIGPENNQPSGLTIYKNRLITVSDKHDNKIYELKLRETNAEQIPLLDLSIDELADKNGPLDLEGITTDNQDNILLVSESHFRVIKVSDFGSKLTWMTPSLKEIGRNIGLFKKRHAFLEGIVFVNNLLLLCGERQPRGIIRYDISNGDHAAYVVNETRLPIKRRRSPDFTGMYHFQDRVFVLHRSTHIVSELVYDRDIWSEGEGYSFGHTENNELYAYTNMIYGRAEGLAMDIEKVYIVLDNNNDYRKSDPADNRPLLLVFKNPFSKKNMKL